MFVVCFREVKNSIFPSDTLMYGDGDGSKHFNIRTCEHMILGQLRMQARQTKNAPLRSSVLTFCELSTINILGVLTPVVPDALLHSQLTHSSSFLR